MTSYNYTILDTTNLATKITTLTARINIDPEINPAILPVTSVVYTAPNIVITFVSPMTGRDSYIVNRMVECIFYGSIPGYTFDYQNKYGTTRKIATTSTDPTVQYDINSGYNSGSTLVNPTGSSMSVCLDSSSGAAKWLKLIAPPTFNISKFWSHTVQTFATLNSYKAIMLEINNISASGTWTAGSGNNQFSSTTAGWYQASYHVDFYPGGVGLATSVVVGVRLILSGASVEDSPTVSVIPVNDSTHSHAYTISRTIPFYYPTAGQIVQLQVIISPLGGITLTSASVGYPNATGWAGFTETTASLSFVKLG